MESKTSKTQDPADNPAYEKWVGSAEQSNAALNFWNAPENQGAIAAFMSRTGQRNIGLSTEQMYNFALMVQGMKAG